MKKRLAIWLAGLFWVLMLGCERPGGRLSFGGGPGGATFHEFAVAMGDFFAGQKPELRLKIRRSGGSVANLTRLEQGKLAMGLVYAGDAYLAGQGILSGYAGTTRNVRALARLYGAAAQLVVLNSSPIQSPYDLKKKRVAVGNPGSGSAINARRFFQALGLWEDITPVYVGFAMGLKDLVSGRVEAAWMLVGVPNASLLETSRKLPLRLIDLFDPAVVSGFFVDYPFYGVALIAAGTYANQPKDVRTFQDSVLWATVKGLDDDLAYRALSQLFSRQGLKYMRSRNSVARDMDADKGLMGVKIPLHPGAERFWKEHGGLPEAGR